MSETYAERIARIASSAAAQAVVDQAPALTRQQLAVVRAACAPATAPFRVPAAVARAS